MSAISHLGLQQKQVVVLVIALRRPLLFIALQHLARTDEWRGVTARVWQACTHTALTAKKFNEFFIVDESVSCAHRRVMMGHKKEWAQTGDNKIRRE